MSAVKTWFEASAPGRLDVMGGIADYSGSLVLQMPVQQKTVARVSLQPGYTCSITSTIHGQDRLEARVDYRDFLLDGGVDYQFARDQFKKTGKSSWIAYVLGCALVLQKEVGINFSGADFELHSDVPPGKGVSSSASVEVATLKALAKAYNLSFSGTALPVLAQRVENLVVGAPCGLMDQLATYFGEAGKLLPIKCQPDDVGDPIAIPDKVFFAGIDSGVKHAVSGLAYARARCAAFMGYTIVARSLGIAAQELARAKEQKNRSALPFKGYLSNISVSEFEERFRALLPETITGKDFLDQFDVSIDDATVVDENTVYPVLYSTAHPIYENDRVNRFAQLLTGLHDGKRKSNRGVALHELGTLMFQSHESYSRCGLGSERTDEIVRLAAMTDGIYGARITGGGQGGTVCLLVAGDEGIDAVTKLHLKLCAAYNQELILFL